MQQTAARQQLRLLGGALGNVDRGDSFLENVLILVQRNIEVVSENGLRTEKRNVASLLVEEVGNLTRGHRLIFDDEKFEISGALDNDGYVTRVFLRG